MVYHSKLTRIFAYICAVIIVAVLVSGMWAAIYLTLVYFGCIQSNLHSNGLLLFIVYTALIYMGRVIYLLIRFLKTLRGKLIYDSIGVSFELNRESTYLEWQALTKSKAYADCQIFVLFDNDGKHIFSIWELATGYGEFRDAFTKNCGI